MDTISIIKSMDWRLNVAVFIMIAVGLVSLASTTPSGFQKQILWATTGIILMFAITKLDLRPIVNYRNIILGIYIGGIGLLMLTYFLAPSIRGARSWLLVGGFRIEPSELMKLALIILYSIFFSRKHASIARVSNLLISFIYFALPGALIAIQPDFGSVSILFAIWLGFLLVSGIKWSHLLIMIIIFSLLGGLMWQSFLKPYQKERVLGFLFPGRDPLGINYSVTQAKTAIGSAGFFGKGFKQGTQSQLGFLPEKQTDFIFAALIEEWGILGGFFVVAVFVYLISRIIKIGLGAENNFGRFICLGTVILFLTQFVLNVGSNIGFTPVIGVTFPLLSYGGSSLLTDLILVGIIQSIYAKRSS